MNPLLKTAMALAIAAVAGTAGAQVEKITVRLDWTPWGVQAAIHLAAQKGWYKEAGLDPEIEDGNGSVTTVQLAGSGKFDVGHASLAPMIIARDKGLPAKAIAVFARKSDVGLLVPKGSVKSIKDLAGKKLVFTAGSLEAPFLDAFLAHGGLKREQVELLNVEASAKATSYVTGRGDGVFSTVPFFLPIVAANRPSDAILFSDYGLQFPSFGLLSSDDKIKARGPALRKFASITAGAWDYIYAGHEDEAVQAIVASRPQSKLDPKILRGQIDALKPFFSTPASQGLPTGLMADADWDAAVRTLVSGKLIQGGKAADLYAKDMIDPALVKKTSSR
jgi:NitT/TauT family transport system substrate-binding protein